MMATRRKPYAFLSELNENRFSSPLRSLRMLERCAQITSAATAASGMSETGATPKMSPRMGSDAAAEHEASETKRVGSTTTRNTTSRQSAICHLKARAAPKPVAIPLPPWNLR